MRNVAIYVEGYHDRDFLSGWLLHRGWKDPGKRKSGREPNIVNPVTGKDVRGGRFGFLSPKESTFVEIVPGHGDGKLLDEIGRKARRVEPPDPDELVIVLDIDDSRLAEGAARREQSVDARLLRSDDHMTREGSVWTLSSGVVVRLALWACEAESCHGVPDAHTLERIVCAAIATAYPTRAAAVQAWLDGRPDVPSRSAKAHSWSYMAGWFAELNCAKFLSNLWNDPKIAATLEELLAASGLDAILRSFE